MDLRQYLKQFPFIAITRGIKPAEAVVCCRILHAAGFRIIETPLNSPDPYRSIEQMAGLFGSEILIGAGTVVKLEQVDEVKKAGGRLVVSPHCDPKIIEKTKECGLISIPGVATPTEMMTAIKAGADALKLFPAEIIGLAGLKAFQAVSPEGTLMIPVGGIDESNWQPYFQAGAAGFGLGSSLYRAGRTPEELRLRAELVQQTWSTGA
jgi:2-dehydro-3-deoxyphosphogalactonate aldolase